MVQSQRHAAGAGSGTGAGSATCTSSTTCSPALRTSWITAATFNRVASYSTRNVRASRSKESRRSHRPRVPSPVRTWSPQSAAWHSEAQSPPLSCKKHSSFAPCSTRKRHHTAASVPSIVASSIILLQHLFCQGSRGQRPVEPHRLHDRRRHDHHRPALLDCLVQHVHRTQLQRRRVLAVCCSGLNKLL